VAELKLSAVALEPASVPLVEKILQVRLLSGNFTTTKLMYKTVDGIYHAYGQHRWERPLGQQFQHLLAASLASGNLFHDVTTQTSRVQPDFVLESDILEYEQHLLSNNSSKVRLHVRIRIVEARTSQSVAHRFFTFEAPAPEHTAQGALHAYNATFEVLTRAVDGWLKTLGERDAL
jgi:ABC-type uncharacterized transport system auxiliary subunit